jgi:hypothetical protein
MRGARLCGACKRPEAPDESHLQRDLPHHDRLGIDRLTQHQGEQALLPVEIEVLERRRGPTTPEPRTGGLSKARMLRLVEGYGSQHALLRKVYVMVLSGADLSVTISEAMRAA